MYDILIRNGLVLDGTGGPGLRAHAAVYGLSSKGLVWEGFDADLCIFDPDKLIDRADYTRPTLRCEGLDYVIVGGKVAAVDAVSTGQLGGTMLYR